MAFVEVQLPDDVEKGAVGGPEFKTTVFIAASGFEQRNIDWAQSRGRWDIGYGIQSKADFRLVQTFFFARQGKAHGFRFKDWSDFQMGDTTTFGQQVGLGDDSTVLFQLFKRYSSGGVDFDRTLVKIVTGTLSVWLEEVLQVGGGTDYTVDLNTGEVTMVVAPASTGGTGPGGAEILTAQCDYDVPVRFDTDKFDISMETFDAGTIPSMDIVELRI